MELVNQHGPHAMSRYTCVTEGVVEKCQQNYLAGRDPGDSLPGFSTTEAAVIVAESLDADRLLDAPLEVLLGRPFGPMNDWSLAVLAELLFAIADQARTIESIPEEQVGEIRERAWAALEQALDSPTASPLLWYEDIYFDVAQEHRMRGDRRAVELMKQGLAHDLYSHEAINADGLLRDLAETYLWVDELDQGLAMFTGLLRNDPADIWTYNVIALIFDRFGLADLGIEATRRGLELIEFTGDPERLHDQFVDSLEDLQQSGKRGRESEIDSNVLADFRAALALDFDAGLHRPITELCRELVPDLDQVAVKGPPEMPDLLTPDMFDWGRRSRQAGQKPGRNDPCWCGSGKKYKHCHMRSDRGKRS
jgi:tetratricopeptide (TPR) repeat protein